MMFLMTEFVVLLVPLRMMSTAYLESEWITMGALGLIKGSASSSCARRKNKASMIAWISAVLFVCS